MWSLFYDLIVYLKKTRCAKAKRIKKKMKGKTRLTHILCKFPVEKVHNWIWRRCYLFENPTICTRKCMPKFIKINFFSCLFMESEPQYFFLDSIDCTHLLQRNKIKWCVMMYHGLMVCSGSPMKWIITEWAHKNRNKWLCVDNKHEMNIIAARLALCNVII